MVKRYFTLVAVVLVLVVGAWAQTGQGDQTTTQDTGTGGVANFQTGICSGCTGSGMSLDDINSATNQGWAPLSGMDPSVVSAFSQSAQAGVGMTAGLDSGMTPASQGSSGTDSFWAAAGAALNTPVVNTATPQGYAPGASVKNAGIASLGALGGYGAGRAIQAGYAWLTAAGGVSGLLEDSGIASQMRMGWRDLTGDLQDFWNNTYWGQARLEDIQGKAPRLFLELFQQTFNKVHPELQSQGGILAYPETNEIRRAYDIVVNADAYAPEQVSVAGHVMFDYIMRNTSRFQGIPW